MISCENNFGIEYFNCCCSISLKSVMDFKNPRQSQGYLKSILIPLAKFLSHLENDLFRNITMLTTISFLYAICDCLNKNRPSSHLPVFLEIPF